MTEIQKFNRISLIASQIAQTIKGIDEAQKKQVLYETCLEGPNTTEYDKKQANLYREGAKRLMKMKDDYLKELHSMLSVGIVNN